MFGQVVEVDEQFPDLILRDAAAEVLDRQLELDVDKVIAFSNEISFTRLPQI